MKRAHLRISCIVVILTAISLGCAGINVETDYDPSIDFANYRTFAWLSAELAVEGGSGNTDNTLLDKRIRHAVNSALAAKGLQRVADDEASLLVSYHIGVQQKLDVQTIHRGHGYGYSRRGWSGGYSDTQVRQYEEGTLLIDLVDPKERHLLWRGSGSARVSRSKTPEEREKVVNNAVNKILERFPPGKKK